MPEKAELQVKTGFFRLGWYLIFCTPRIEIDGDVHVRPWGEHAFDLPPGEHVVTIYFRYFLKRRCCENSVKVVLRAGETARIKYFAPPWVFMKGRMKVA